jgi:molybdate transport system regulatory protein
VELKLNSRKKVWLEYNGEPILGKGRYLLLKTIDNTNSLKKSAKICGISEKTAHNYVDIMEKRLSRKLILSERGGKSAGGRSVLTKDAFYLILEFEKIYDEDCEN